MKKFENGFKIVPIPGSLARRARSTMKDEEGNALAIRRDDARHQCRSCLALTQPGEGFILLSYRPFASHQPYAESGPVFIHERECAPYADARTYPPEFPRSEVVLRAYGPADEIVDAALVIDQPAEEIIGKFFADSRVSYIHARNAAYGCFMFRVERG